MSDLYLRAAGKFLQLPVILALFVFLPAGTFHYWEGCSAVFVTCTLAITLYLAAGDPQLLERRMNAGPRAEKEPKQKIIVLGALLSLAAMPVLSAIDRRWMVKRAGFAGDLGKRHDRAGLCRLLPHLPREYLWRRHHRGGRRSRVIATGPYAVVRHPMYSWALLMMLEIHCAGFVVRFWSLSRQPLRGLWLRSLMKSNSWPGTFRGMRITCARSRID